LATTTAWYLTAAGIGALDLWTDSEGEVDLQTLRHDLAALNSDTTVILRSFESTVREHAGLPMEGAGPSAPRTGDVGRTRRAGTRALQGADQIAGVIVCADVTAAVLAQVNDIALRQRMPLLAGRGGAQPHLATYAGHDAAHPCATCDPQPPVREREATAPDPTSALIGSLLALEAIKASLGLTGFRPGTGLHYDPQNLTISEGPIGKRARCRACTPAGGSET
jgi:hypothetical protein